MKKIITAVILTLVCFPLSVLGSADELTRIDFIAMVMQELDLEETEKAVSISDISESDANYRYAASAIGNGIISGYGGGVIMPYSPIKREDALLIFSRAYNIAPDTERYLVSIDDRDEISGYARGAIAGIIKSGIMELKGTLSPKGYITADEAEEMTALFRQYSRKKLSFSYGYPRLANDAERNTIKVEIKTTQPCEVYYRLVPNSVEFANYIPSKNEINRPLATVSSADDVVSAQITPTDKNEYNLYIMAAEGSKYTMGVIGQVRAHSFTEGDGTKSNPYRICDEDQLKSIKYHPESCFRLENDISLTTKWKPIDAVFSGELDGNYHKITNININDSKDDTGIFREISGAKVEKLYLDATVYGGQNTGIIAGRSSGCEISECFVTGRVYSEGNNAGGIVGTNGGVIENCVSAAYLLEAKGYAGGIAGANAGGKIENCLSAVYSVSADMYASGIAGINNGGSIRNTISASFYADDIISAKSGRVTTNKEGGICENNYCYDKMMSNSEVLFGYDTHDGLEATWQELTSREFYHDVMGWDTDNIWSGGTDTDFRLPFPKGFPSIGMIKGITIYAPAKISTEAELRAVRNNPNMHYIMIEDIVLGDDDWDIIAEQGGIEEGFGGSFDGNNHTITGMHIGTKEKGKNYGMFGVISSGTVRNLSLKDLTIDGESLAGGIAAENYGYIENCNVSGKIYALRKDNMLSVGGICGNNYGFIENVKSDTKIRADGQVLTIGGIVANNEGYVNNTEFTGYLNAELSDEYSNAVAGGICGINMSGIIYNSFAEPKIMAKASTNYVGGIVGIASGGEVYKAYAGGEAVVYSKGYTGAAVYAGGIAGLAPSGLIMNSVSDMTITTESNAVYAGGIVGYNTNASVQNTYSTSNIDVTGRNATMSAPCYVGGICGLSESGFVSDSVAVNEQIICNGISAAVGNAENQNAVFSNNYSADNIPLGGMQFEFSENGERKSSASILKKDFFFKPIAEGGALGWVEGDIWYSSEENSLPLLYGVSK